MTLQRTNSGPRRGASGSKASDDRPHPPAEKMASRGRKSQPTEKPRLNADSTKNPVLVSKRALRSDNSTGVASKEDPKPESSKVTPSDYQKTKNNGVFGSSSLLARGSPTSLTSRKGQDATTDAVARGVEQVDHVDAPTEKKEKKKDEILSLPTWKEEMGIVFGKPVVKNAVRKQVQRSVENASKPTFHAWFPSILRTSPARVVEDECKRDKRDDLNSRQLEATFRALVIKDELDSANARIRANLLPVLPDYRILNVLPKSIDERLTDEPGRCTASVLNRAPPHDRCKNLTFSKTDVLEIPGLLENLGKLDVRAGEWPEIRAKLFRLAELSLCKRTHASKAKETLRTLDIQIAQWPDDPTHYKDMEGTLMLLIKALKQIPNNQRISELREHLNRLYDHSSEAFIPQQFSPKARFKQAMPAAIPSFVPYEPHNDYMQYLLNGSMYQATSRILNAPLADKELDAKYMYIYWFKDKPEYIKIGVSHDVSRRLRSWQVKCGHSDCEHARDERLKYPIKHAFRVERLVHAALKDVRCQTDRCGCGGYHIEWFRTDVERALSVIGVIADLMNEQPYAFDREVKAVCLKRTEKMRKRCAEVLQVLEKLVSETPADSKAIKQDKHTVRRLAPVKGNAAVPEEEPEDPAEDALARLKDGTICLGNDCRHAAAG